MTVALLVAALLFAPGLESLLARLPADSLLAPVRRYEVAQRHGARAAEAALVLGQLHLVRGEYRLAAEAFGRAAAGFEPGRKEEARYWAGVAWLGAGDARRARSRFEEIERGAGPRRALATLGMALAWAREGQPERAAGVLEVLTRRGDVGDALPSALEAQALLADRLGHADVARRARERLRHECPRSFEALGTGAEAGPGDGAFRP